MANVLVLIGDPIDGYDAVWAFENEEDANLFRELSDADYALIAYAGIELSRIIDESELGKFKAPTEPVSPEAMGVLRAIANPEEVDEFEDDYSLDNDAFYAWLGDYEHFSVQTPGLFMNNEEDFEEENEDSE